MIYFLVKKLVRLSLAIFFKKIVVTGKEHIPDNGPLIIVSNHPNTFMDALVVAILAKQRIGFVGNASVFANKMAARFFRYFHVIPIYRKKDIPAGEKPDNRSTFRECHAYLEGEGTFLIFPEGSSYYELKLRDIKTGTARIALSYEALKGFNGKLQILPIALDYSDAIQFRSMLSVSINPPLTLESYQQEYEEDEFKGVLTLTEDIRKELAEHIPQTSGKKQESFLVKAHSFYTTFHESEADLHQNPKRSLDLRKQLSQALKFLQKHQEELYQDTQTKVFAFFEGLKQEKLTPGFFTDQFLNKSPFLVCLVYALTFLSLLPVYLFGIVTNYLPYILPSTIFKALHIDIEYKAPVQMVVGVITFPLFYLLDLWLFRTFVNDGRWESILFLIALPIAGYIAMYFYTEAKRFMRVLHFYFFMKDERKTALLVLRDRILENIEIARDELLGGEG